MKSKVVLRSLIAVFIISMFCAVNSFAKNAAARDDSTRVTVGQNGYGDVLLGQIYQTLWDYQTRIKVINTSATDAVVAKVVFRSAVNSCDVFDFAIYLTPTDVWEGIVRLNAAGNPEIYSTDDSVLASEQFTWDGTAACNPFSGVWASEATPFQREFYTDCLTTNADGAVDVNTFGHFEILGLASFPATAPLSKDTLAMAYGNIWNVPAVAIGGLIGCDFNLNGPVADCPNVLTGTETLENSYWNQKSSVSLVALKNWENAPVLTNTNAMNNLHDSAFNTVGEVEAALAKTQYSVPFDFSANGDADVILINTFPTHYEIGIDGDSSAVFKVAGEGVCEIKYNVYDMEETRILDFLSGDTFLNCLPEVSQQGLLPNIQKAVDNGYEKGWVNVTIPGKGVTAAMSAPNDVPIPVTYTGIPSINSYITVTKDGDIDWNYATSPESIVTYGDINVRQ